ncbi:hypothetical protein VCM39_00835 [Bacteroides sp. CG01]|uniref:hypothetical protein n=1 Tax=Bacteroides sp. CG01 TaxID=3096000 RepID=UPI002AFECD01|nr:hypothetical protein [Bacteroides sp. CG01]
MITNSVVSGVTGFTVGAGWTALNGGSFEESMQAGWNSAKVGFAVGGAIGSFSGWQSTCKPLDWKIQCKARITI